VTKFKTAILLPIKCWTGWYMDHVFALSHSRVTNFQKWSGFYGPPGRKSDN